MKGEKMSRSLKPACSAIFLGLMLLVVAGSARRATATARHFTWDTSITYQNIGDSATPVQIQLYDEGSSSPTILDPLNGGTLAPGAGRSLYLGHVTTSGYQGNVVLIANEPLATTSVRFRLFPPALPVRLLYRGFDDVAGANTYILPTVLSNAFDRTTIFSIQNLETYNANVTIEFFDSASGNSLGTIAHTVGARSSKIIEMDKTADTGLTVTTVNGSAIITAAGFAKMVVAGSEYYLNRAVAADFEGVPESAASGTIYMATALCRSYDIDTYYAVTNVGSIATTVTITYYAANGTVSGAQTTGTLAPGQKVSIYTCNGGVGNNFSGSAVITANSQGALLVALGKAQQQIPPPADPTATQNFSTIFLGEPVGGSRLAFSYIRWANGTDYNNANNYYGGYQRSYLAVRNLESATIKVNARYYGKDGNLCATAVLTIPQNGKANTSPESAGALGGTGACSGLKIGAFGYYLDNTFGGAVILEAHSDNPNAKFIAINRTQHHGAGEDVNAVPAP